MIGYFNIFKSSIKIIGLWRWKDNSPAYLMYKRVAYSSSTSQTNSNRKLKLVQQHEIFELNRKILLAENLLLGKNDADVSYEMVKIVWCTYTLYGICEEEDSKSLVYSMGDESKMMMREESSSVCDDSLAYSTEDQTTRSKDVHLNTKDADQ